MSVDSELTWFKSSHSNPDGETCVEVAPTPTTIHIRDSKNTSGPALAVPPTAWAEFLRLIV
ncbi:MULTISPECIES: DUF397 domain-containing protein [Streptomyces]|uniref:DUF397 domain-containing protein n=2 Tax=Streptomyces rimosus subsp. rimosus TaxID=132474 RepID=L8EN59_STRR1|nr:MULTISPECIES: DUF397 domain-containing protein [Streptomyces]KOG81904.1 DNA-binding protein [Kitasatospora aureofaciens]MYT44127.1 DUF397 domain-containing protein [Streptomyces sp. SID5471]KUJ28407.1 DNA-binding protein [Streptomyces rimosus subsp. rimosus]QDA06162.1 DUF397 domain-containing protein [Streptomyces rimosus]QEV77438.1 DUF397 domain-containing protein [Streptomyces rimosus]